MSAAEIIAHAKISQVYEVATGIKPRPAGPNKFRAPAVWRGGDSWDSVSLNDEFNAWNDFVTGDKGGLLGMIIRIRGGSRGDALRWLADLLGLPLDHRPQSVAEREQSAQQRAAAEGLALEAENYACAAIPLTEQALEELPLGDPARYVHTSRMKGLKISPQAEYLAARQRNPNFAAAVVRAGADRRHRLETMILAFLLEDNPHAS